MKPIVRKYSVCTLLLLAVVFSSSSAADKTDFRKTRWGMTKLEVMSLEESPPIEFTGNRVIYQVEIWGRKVHLVYDFINNKLVHAQYMIITRPGKEYRDYKETVVLKYGHPDSDMDDDNGDYRYVWETPTTMVVMRPGRDRELLIEYTGKKFTSLRAQLDKSAHDKVIRDLKSTF